MGGRVALNRWKRCQCCCVMHNAPVSAAGEPAVDESCFKPIGGKSRFQLGKGSYYTHMQPSEIARRDEVLPTGTQAAGISSPHLHLPRSVSDCPTSDVPLGCMLVCRSRSIVTKITSFDVGQTPPAPCVSKRPPCIAVARAGSIRRPLVASQYSSKL